MPLTKLEYSPTSRNTRVTDFEVPGDEQPKVYSTESLISSYEKDELIKAAYLQVFHEQQFLDFNRQSFLESQLKAGQITVKEFVRGLVVSDSFCRLNYEVNNNYRFVELCVQRLLGRQVYNEREQFAWSIVLATKGLREFVTELLESDEYASNFGEDTVPYQRRRILLQRAEGELTFAHTSRYDADFRDNLPVPSRNDLFRASEVRGLGSSSLNLSSQDIRLLAIGVATVIFAALWLIYVP